MLMTEATHEMLEEWKIVWDTYRARLKPNRKTGKEIVDFLYSRYPLDALDDARALNTIVRNVLDNEPYAEKLMENEEPLPKAFVVKKTGSGQKLYENQDDIFDGLDIFIGVDLVTGFYCVEGSSFLWDELCAFQGLDDKDIENYFCVAQYISCLERFDLLEEVLNS